MTFDASYLTLGAKVSGGRAPPFTVMHHLPESLLTSTGSWVRSGVLRGAPELIQQLGGDVMQVCSDAGVPAIAIKDEDFPLTAGQVANFFSLAAQACCKEDFGLRLSTRQDLAVLGPVWLLMQNAADVRQMLLDLARYFMLHTRGAVIGVEPAGDGITVSYGMVGADSLDDRQTIELGLGLICHEMRRHGGTNWQPRAVQFRHSPPLDLTLHHRIFGPNLGFNQDNNAVTLDAALLARPLATSSRRHHQLLDKLLDQQRRQAPQAILWTVETTVRALLPYSACTLVQVAQALALSQRTLQRRLREAGSSYVDIRDRVRAGLALKYLRQSNLSSSQIAEILGYSDLSALSRSFRRWHGITTRQARQQRPPAF